MAGDAVGLELSEDAVSGLEGAVSDGDSVIVIGSDVESGFGDGVETGAGSGWV